MKSATLNRPAKPKPPQAKLAAEEKSPRGPDQLVRAIQKGLPFHELETLRSQLALPLEQLAEKLGIARATLHRRKVSGRLDPDESDKVIRFARLFAQAEEVFEGETNARQWLSFPQYGLGGAIPLDYARTEVGAREVEKLLFRIEYSVYV
jgi:putative toxin-antitoxin system antitoxin component (TIGR02293 family)